MHSLKIADLFSSPAQEYSHDDHEDQTIVDARVSQFFSAVFAQAPLLQDLDVSHHSKWVSNKDRQRGVTKPPKPNGGCVDVGARNTLTFITRNSDFLCSLKTVRFVDVSAPSLESLRLVSFNLELASFDGLDAPNMSNISFSLIPFRHRGGGGGGGSSDTSLEDSVIAQYYPSAEQGFNDPFKPG